MTKDLQLATKLCKLCIYSGPYDAKIKLLFINILGSLSKRKTCIYMAITIAIVTKMASENKLKIGKNGHFG